MEMSHKCLKEGHRKAQSILFITTSLFLKKYLSIIYIEMCSKLKQQNPIDHKSMVKQVKTEKKELVKKYQYTKPYKQRDRTKDIGIDKPLIKNNRLKFPEKPQYYMMHTVQRLTKADPIFNVLNRDRAKVQKQYRDRLAREQEAKHGLANATMAAEENVNRVNHVEQSYQTNSFNTPSNRFQTHSNTNESSLGIVTISQISKSASNSPFSRGYSVTSGPRIYKTNTIGSKIDQNSASIHSPFASDVQPSNVSIGSAVSMIYQNQAYCGSVCSNRPSV